MTDGVIGWHVFGLRCDWLWMVRPPFHVGHINGKHRMSLVKGYSEIFYLFFWLKIKMHIHPLIHVQFERYSGVLTEHDTGVRSSFSQVHSKNEESGTSC